MGEGLANRAWRAAKGGAAVISGGVVNWRASVKPATKVGATGTFLLGSPKPATRITSTPARLLAGERPATEMVRVQYDLAHASHAVTAAQDAGGTGTWANPTRAQGAPNDPGDHSGDSDIGGSGALLITGLLRATMVSQPVRGNLVITRVDLDWYGQTVGLPAVDDIVSRLILGYRINLNPIPAADKDTITLSVGTTNFHAAQGPQTARIDNGAGAFTDVLGTAVTWANISLIQPYFKASIVLGLTGCHYYADAVRLRVTATETQLL